jgi:hypothetical protein
MNTDATGLEAAIATIPANWFITALGEMTTPVTHSGNENRGHPGNRHERMAFGCSLQHRRGGLLTLGESDTLAGAVASAVGKLPLDVARSAYGEDA